MGEEDLHRIIDRLRHQGSDDARTEAKACSRDLGSSVWESVSAFANTDGGLLLLGLDEASGFGPAPGFDPDRTIDKFVEGIGDGGSTGRVTAPPQYAIERLSVGDAPIVAITIEPNSVDARPCYVTARGVQGGSYKRVDDKDIKLSSTEIHEMQTVRLPSDEDRRPVPRTTLNDLDSSLVDQLLARKKGSRALHRADTRDEQLARLNVVTHTGELTLAGLLVLGVYPQQYFPRLLVDVTVHPANHKSSAGKGLRFVDRTLCEGNLPEVIDTAVDAAAKNLRTFSLVDAGGREDQLEIPPEVLREAIANAVLHREYHPLFIGTPVTVDIYPDRVAITSPGGMWGGKTKENIADGRSECRNASLLRLLQDVPTSSARFTVEGQGSGVPLMINEMRAHALEAPQFTTGADLVRVDLGRHGAEIPAFRAWLQDVADRSFNQSEQTALLMAKQDGSVSVADLRERLAIDSSDAGSVLELLKADGLLRLQSPGTYSVSDGSPLPDREDADVIRHLSTERPVSIHELSETSGRPISTLRPILRRLVAAGWVQPTAPPQSRNRKYLAVGTQ